MESGVRAGVEFRLGRARVCVNLSADGDLAIHTLDRVAAFGVDRSSWNRYFSMANGTRCGLESWCGIDLHGGHLRADLVDCELIYADGGSLRLWFTYRARFVGLRVDAFLLGMQLRPVLY